MTGGANGEPLYEVYQMRLRNTHALEMMAIGLAGRQVERLQRHPGIAARLQQNVLKE